MTFGNRLAELRKSRKMTQSDLGRGLGTDGVDVGKQVVYGWVKGLHFPRVDQLLMICARLGCSADYLLLGTERALSPQAVELGTEFDKIEDPRDRERALMLCLGAVRLARGVSEHSERHTQRKAG